MILYLEDSLQVVDLSRKINRTGQKSTNPPGKLFIQAAGREGGSNVQDKLALKQIIEPKWQTGTVRKEVASYILEDLKRYGFGEIETWHTDDPGFWEERFDGLLYEKMQWSNDKLNKDEEENYDTVIGSMAAAAIEELKKRQMKCLSTLNNLRGELTKEAQ